jgi:hypothetical protein
VFGWWSLADQHHQKAIRGFNRRYPLTRIFANEQSIKIFKSWCMKLLSKIISNRAFEHGDINTIEFCFCVFGGMVAT